MYPSISEEKQEFIRQHMNDDTSWSKLAKQIGIATNTFARYAKRFGGKSLFFEKRVITDDDIRSLYPDHTAPEIAKIFGCSTNWVNIKARKLGVRHSDELIAVLKKKSLVNISKTWTPEIRKVAIATRKHTRIMENFRVNSGMPQQTRMRLKQIPYKASKVKCKLRKEHGYIRSKDDLFLLYYDENTRRTPNEDYFTKKYHLKFMERNGGQED